MPVRRKRTMRRKRNMRRKYRKTTRRSNTTPDGTYSEKLNYEFELLPGSATNSNATMQIHWTHSIPQLGGANTIVAPVGSNLQNTQFNQCAQMFREYKVTGLSLKYRPYILQQNPSVASLYQCKGISIGTIMNYPGAAVNPISLTEFRGSLDFKVFSADRPFKRYYKVSKWAKGVDQPWRYCADALTDTYTWGNAYPDCITCVQMDQVGIPSTAPGVFTITYYLKLKSRTRC